MAGEMIMTDYQVDQDVVVFVGWQAQAYPGKITKVGRELVTINAPGYGEGQFRMDTRRSNNKQFGSGTYFRTPEEHAEAQIRSLLIAELRKAGIELRMGHGMDRKLTTGQMEAILAIARGAHDGQ
jgi:hypothetical protein